MAIHRNRVIYQSEALFVSPDSTGAHFTGAAIANAETPADYAAIAANVGPGPFGLVTPPTNARQVFGGTAANPAMAGGRALAGWTQGDAWPEWNPECSTDGTFATFQAMLEIQNLDSPLQIVGDTANSDLDTNVDLVFDGINDLNTIIATTLNNLNPLKQYTATAGGNAVFPATTAGVQLSNGDVGNTAAQVRQPTWNGTGRVDIVNNGGGVGPATVLTGNGVDDVTTLAAAYNATPAVVADAALQITLGVGQAVDPTFIPSLNELMVVGTNNVQGSLGFQLVSVDAALAADAITFATDGVASIGALMAAHNADATKLGITSQTVLANTIVVDNELGFIPDAEANITFAGGRDPVFSSFNGVNIPTIAANRAVSVTSTVRGAGGNITIVADGITNITALLAGRGAVDAGDGNWIPSNNEQIVLSNGLTSQACAHGTIIKQLKRVQSANYGFTINRQDVNQFGHLARLDTIVVESPTVNLDFSYYLLDGYNERMIEFVTDGVTNALSGHLAPEIYQAGCNYFILTTPEARDAVNGDINLHNADKEDLKTVISLGNGYVTDYSIDISVGSIPTASVTVEGMNIKSDIGATGNDVPGMDMRDGSMFSKAFDKDANGVRQYRGENGCTGLYSLPPASSGYAGCGSSDAAALRPGDVVLNLKDGGLISRQVEDGSSKPLVGSAHIQSASISVPMSRSNLERLGSTFGFSKLLDAPISVTLSVSALLSDIKEGNMADMLCDCSKMDLELVIYDPECADCQTKDGTQALVYTLKGAQLDGENFSTSIGDSKTVDLTFSTSVGGGDDTANGFFISGKESSEASIKGLPPSWTGLNNEANSPAEGKYLGYRA